MDIDRVHADRALVGRDLVNDVLQFFLGLHGRAFLRIMNRDAKTLQLKVKRSAQITPAANGEIDGGRLDGQNVFGPMTDDFNKKQGLKYSSTRVLYSWRVGRAIKRPFFG